MLGRHGKLEKEPEIKYGGVMLASALATHVRRKIDPEPYGQGGEIPRDRVGLFIEEVVQTFNERVLYLPIIDRYKLSETDLAKARQKLIQYASKSAPAGLRGKTERELRARLIV